MCGIAGYFTKENVIDPSVILNGMGLPILHRGPDSSGEWFCSEFGVGLSHRRLAIVDLSVAGHQPMHSKSNRYVISFNGEIYNHLDIRQELGELGKAPEWQGHSDTETLLAGFDAWGIRETVVRCVGMFAFAVWDTAEKVLTLGRDRLGEKPLYYGWQGEHFLFGSELKALKAHPAFLGNINRDAIALLLRHNCIPAPFSIYNGINKLMPGCLVSISVTSMSPVIEEYWSAKSIVETGISNQYKGNIDTAVNDLEVILKKAISDQMMADVPLGAFLSGGVDSSTIVALMQAQSNRPIKTFSIGYYDEKYNEAHFAKAIAEHLGTEHTELYLKPEDALEVIPSLARLYDEPFADASQIPTYLVSKMARQYVTVSLSGDAGDELFCGYNRYIMIGKTWKLLSKLPLWFRKLVAGGIKILSPNTWTKLFSFVAKVLPSKYSKVSVPFGDRLYKGANVLVSKNVSDAYQRIVSLISNPEDFVLGANEPLTVFRDSSLQPKNTVDVETMMAVDLVSYLPNDILTKVDRAAMGVSLETRVPFLDHRVVEFAWSLPLSYKFRDGIGKWALRQVLYKHIPKALMERPKMGFAIPIDEWLRGPLKSWAESLLDERRLLKEGFLHSKTVRAIWLEHLSGKKNWHHQLWSILMFQAWLEEQN